MTYILFDKTKSPIRFMLLCASTSPVVVLQHSFVLVWVLLSGMWGCSNYLSFFYLPAFLQKPLKCSPTKTSVINVDTCIYTLYIGLNNIEIIKSMRNTFHFNEVQPRSVLSEGVTFPSQGYVKKTAPGWSIRLNYFSCFNCLLLMCRSYTCAMVEQ